MKLNSMVKILFSLSFFLLCLFINSLNLKSKEVKRYVYDIKHSLFLKNPSDVNYTEKKVRKTSLHTEVIFANIIEPIFIIENKDKLIYLSKKCEIINNICADKTYKLIKLVGVSNFETIPEIYNNIKNLNVLTMTLIDNRRWKITILKNENIINIDFPAGMPDIKYFEDLDKKYELTKKYKNIDLRFQSKIGILN